MIKNLDDNYFYDDFSILFKAYQKDETLDFFTLNFIQFPLLRAYLQSIEDFLETEHNNLEKILEEKVKNMKPSEIEVLLSSQ